jgi:hypothetical protein
MKPTTANVTATGTQPEFMQRLQAKPRKRNQKPCMLQPLLHRLVQCGIHHWSADEMQQAVQDVYVPTWDMNLDPSHRRGSGFRTPGSAPLIGFPGLPSEDSDLPASP